MHEILTLLLDHLVIPCLGSLGIAPDIHEDVFVSALPLHRLMARSLKIVPEPIRRTQTVQHPALLLKRWQPALDDLLRKLQLRVFVHHQAVQGVPAAGVLCTWKRPDDAPGLTKLYRTGVTDAQIALRPDRHIFPEPLHALQVLLGTDLVDVDYPMLAVVPVQAPK